MAKILYAAKRYIVTLFLLSLSSVLICDILCDLQILNRDIYSHNHQEERSSDYISGAKHDHKTHTNNFDTSHSHGTDSDHHPKNNECCKDETSRLLSSLIKHKSVEIQFIVKYLALTPIEFGLKKWKPKSLLDDVLVLGLSPPRTRNIRILIQSFLN